VINMGEAGVTRAIEFGGKVLGPMVKRSAPDLAAVSLLSMDDIEAILKDL